MEEHSDLAQQHEPFSLKEMWKDLLCGSLGGFAGTVVSHPLDTIRVRLQLQHLSPENYKGMFDCASQSIKAEGFLGLYKGVVPPVAFIMPWYAMLFAGKEFGDRALKRYTNVDDYTKALLAGWMGGLWSTLVSAPSELLKIRAQNNTSGKTNYLEISKTMYKEGGIKYFFKGYSSVWLRDIPSFTVYFGIFDVLTKKYLKEGDSLSKELFLQTIFGSMAGIASWVVIYPVDIVKSIIQYSHHHITIREAFTQTYAQYGAKFFFRGIVPTAIRAVPMEATCLVLYSQIRKLM